MAGLVASSQNVPLFSLQNAGTGIVFVHGYMNMVTSNFWKYFIVGAKGYIRRVCLKTVLHYSGWLCFPPMQAAGGVPQCTRTQRTFKEYLLESALAMDLSREIAIAVTSAKALIQQNVKIL